MLRIFRAVHSGGAEGAVAPARKTKCFFSNIVSDFAGLFLLAILVRNLTKTINEAYGLGNIIVCMLQRSGLK